MTTSRIGNKSGFSLVEVMLAVSILAIGTVMVQQGFLRSAGLFHEASQRLAAETWLETKLAEVREKMVYADDASFQSESGTFEAAGRTFAWSVDIEPEAAGTELYAVTLEARWQSAGRDRSAEKRALLGLRDKLL